MDQQEAVNIARQVVMNSGMNAGMPCRVTYHPEGGKSLDNIMRIRNYESLLSIPYYEVAFDVNETHECLIGLTHHTIGDSTEVVVIVFESMRAFLKSSSSVGIRVNI